MNNKQKSWLLIGPVIFSFAMAMTNREWLRSLTDEELADFFIDDRRSLNGGICNICAHDVNCMYDKTLKCNSGIATWLKQEYTGVWDYD